MRVFLAVLVLIFSLQSWAKADDISDFQIEGMSIGDSLLGHFSEEEIKKKMDTDYRSKEFSRFENLDPNNYELYDGMQFHFKTKDRNFIIYEFSGIIFFEKKIDKCYKKKEEITKELTSLFKEADFEDHGTQKHPDDTSGKSFKTDVYFYFKTGEGVQISCFDWSDEREREGYTDHLRISLGTKEIIDWFINKAY